MQSRRSAAECHTYHSHTQLGTPKSATVNPMANVQTHTLTRQASTVSLSMPPEQKLPAPQQHDEEEEKNEVERAGAASSDEEELKKIDTSSSSTPATR